MKENNKIKVFVISDNGEVVEIDDLDRLIESLRYKEESKAIVVKGEIIGTLTFSSKTKEPLESPEKHEKKAKKTKVVAVLDQMFRGFANIIVRETENIEVHEILGRGLESRVKIGERLFRHPAKDDFDVLKIVEKLAKEENFVAFFTGDKSLANQASALRLKNVMVYYMPPNEYPGKESLVRTMISELNKLTKKLNNNY